MERPIDRGYGLAPPFHGPYITPRQAHSIKIKRCPTCEQWKRIGRGGDFNTAGKRKDGLPRWDGWCRPCRLEASKAAYYRNHEARVQLARDAYYRRRKDPAAVERMREAERERQRRYRQARPDVEHDRQQRYRARVNADPVRLEAKRRRRREWYWDQGGREVVWASRARRRKRYEFLALVAASLRVELERREAAARAARERKRAQYAAWITERRRAFGAGETGWEEPEFQDNGQGEPELARLPAGPLAKWIERDPRPMEEMAAEAGIDSRNLRRYTTGESVTVALEIVDRLMTRLDVLMIDVYDPGRYPAIYEPEPV